MLSLQWLENVWDLLQNNLSHKKLEFKVSNESAWDVGLACGGEIAVYLEKITV